MADPQRCDVAVWDVDGTLTAVVRGELTGRQTHQGPRIVVDSGEWHGRRIAIGRPSRVTAARLPTLSEGTQALTLAHPPRLLVVVGPAGVATGRGQVGDVLIAQEVRSRGEVLQLPSPELLLELPCGRFSSEPVSEGSDEAMTAGWAAAAAEAALERDAPTLLLAVATVEGASLGPPSSRPRTLAREAGGFVGRLLAGKWPMAEKRAYSEHAARALEQIVAAL